MSIKFREVIAIVIAAFAVTGFAVVASAQDSIEKIEIAKVLKAGQAVQQKIEREKVRDDAAKYWAAIAAASAQVPRTQSTQQTTRGFSVVLVVGDLQAGGTADGIPEAARKALNDMKDFLPYKSYRLVDAAWILGSAGATTRLSGPDDRPYQLEVGAQPGADNGLQVHVRLDDTGLLGVPKKASAVDLAAIDSIKKKMEEAEAQRVQAAQKAQAQGTSSASQSAASQDAQRALEKARQQVTELEAQLKAEQQKQSLAGRPDFLNVIKPGAFGKLTSTTAIVNSNFTMAVGETVVVGTSRVMGDKALIVLLTAVAAGK